MAFELFERPQQTVEPRDPHVVGANDVEPKLLEDRARFLREAHVARPGGHDPYGSAKRIEAQRAGQAHDPPAGSLT